MKKRYAAACCVAAALSLLVSGCGGSGEGADAAPAVSGGSGVETETEMAESAVTELEVRFGDDGEPFVMYLEDNSTAEAIAHHVGTSSWRLPIYHYDDFEGSDVMQYYDIPSRYEIPDNSEEITSAKAGEVYYSDPNRIVLFYHDAEVTGEYTKVGQFDYSEEFVSAVENNPVLEGWGNKIVHISTGE